MKARLLVAVLALLITRNAYAQDACAPYNKWLAAAPDGFVQFKGRQIRPSLYEAEAFPGFTQCALRLIANGEAQYACYRVAGSEREGQDVLESILEDLRSCFSNWQRESLVELDRPSDRLIELEGQRYLGSQTQGRPVVGAGLYRTKSENPIQYVLSIGFLFLPTSVGS